MHRIRNIINSIYYETVDEIIKWRYKIHENEDGNKDKKEEKYLGPIMYIDGKEINYVRKCGIRITTKKNNIVYIKFI